MATLITGEAVEYKLTEVLDNKSAVYEQALPDMPRPIRSVVLTSEVAAGLHFPGAIMVTVTEIEP